ncbi:hypothetical protein [Streptomyces sp. NBC_00083]|uniref:ARPP-2 domain-containing protein n=1 Tax=Streptomyces sp. NBC_00083 TaxID=2975647 RepID=UPI0022559F71|nr:hypothetical protein [Streptomyces sp. NBC_00083]MCX5382842.1 hypothetical protein [Streptomyces sp. NBC_00083]
MTSLDLTGLTAGPAQVWGGIRLVPLLRAEPVAGLRLHREAYGTEEHETSLMRLNDGGHYTSYIPHGFVADWSGEGTGAAYGTSLGEGPPSRVPLHRMAKRRPGDRLRFLPLHLALEGYLALHFGGPSVLWDTWSREAVRSGLSPRVESAYLGTRVPGLADALRVFEIHPGQCGVLVYAADALGGAFAVPHPDDYRALHATLLQDLFGELIHQYARYGRPVEEFAARIDDRHVRGVADLRAAARAQERAWREAHDSVLAAELYDASYAFSRVYRMGGFDLWRFLPPFLRSGRAQHIGEAITDRKGRVAYLKTFRLSENQVRRGHLLQSLAAHDWHLGRCAEALGTTPEELTRRMRHAGFSALLKPSR